MFSKQKRNGAAGIPFLYVLFSVSSPLYLFMLHNGGFAHYSLRNFVVLCLHFYFNIWLCYNDIPQSHVTYETYMSKHQLRCSNVATKNIGIPLMNCSCIDLHP